MSQLSNPNKLKCAKLAERIQKLKEICNLNYDESSLNLKEIGRVAEVILRQASIQLREIKSERDDVYRVDRAESLNEFERWVREQDVFNTLRKEKKRTLLEESFGINLKEVDIEDEKGEEGDRVEATEEVDIVEGNRVEATEQFVQKIKKSLRDMRSESYEERKTTKKKMRTCKNRNSIHHKRQTSLKSTQNRASRDEEDISIFHTSPSSHSQPSLLPILPPSIPSTSLTSFITPHLPNDTRSDLYLNTFKLEQYLPRISSNLDPSYRYIFYPEPFSKNLHVFSISTGQRFVLHISHLSDNFYPELSACLLPDFSLFISGGHCHGKMLKTCFIINLNSMDVVYQPKMKYPRCGHCSIYLNKAIYVFGGVSQMAKSLLRKSEKFILSQRCWYKIGSLGTARMRMSPAVCNGKIHIAGGHGARNYVIYDPVLDRYTIKGKLENDTPTISLFIGRRIQILQKGVLHCLNHKGVLKVKASWVMNSEIYSLMPAEVEKDTGYFFNYDGRIYMFKAEDIPRLVCLTP